MYNNKSPGNDGLPKEFYETFWDNLQEPLLSLTRTSFLRQEVSSSLKHAVIKLIEKKDEDKRFKENWRSISVLMFAPN